MARLAVLASCAVGASAFTPAAQTLRRTVAEAPTGQQPAAPGSAGTVAFGRCVASAAGLGAVVAASAAAATAKSRRTARVACAAKVITNVDGKARFVVDGAAPVSSGSSGPFKPEEQLGAQAPLGFWDPLGFCADITELEFKRLRSAEIKHGRIAMLASIGYIYPFYDRLPGFLSKSAGLTFADIPNGVAAISKIPSGGWAQMFLFAILCEFGLNPSMEEWKTGEPGDLGKGFLGMFGPVTDPEKKKRSLAAEISNGRLAMAAITGMVIQEGVAGTTGPEMWFGA